MFDKKKTDPECPRLTEAMKAAIPDAHTDPRMVELGQRRQKMLAELHDVENQLNGEYHYDEARQAAALSQLVATGALPENTLQVSVDLVKEQLRVNRDLLAKGIEENQHQMQVTEQKVIFDNCEKADPVARELNKAVIEKMESLHEALLAWQEFLTLLSRRGNPDGKRQDRMRLMPFESCILFGGTCTTMEHYLACKKKFWDIK